LFLLFNEIHFHAFLWSLYFSYGAGFLISLYAVRNIPAKSSFKEIFRVGKIGLGYGFMSQLANIAQLINLRLNFFVLEHFYDHESVGLFSTGSTIAESIWLIGGAISIVQYSKISNTFDKDESVKISAKLGKTGLIVSIISFLPLLLIPEHFYTTILGSDFKGIKDILLLLSPGIILIGFSLAFSHYFAGTGKYWINTISSFLGVLFTLIGSFILIPKFGVYGAAISASISYTFITLILMMYFVSESKIGIRKLLPQKEDFVEIFRLIINYFPKLSKGIN
jgi:O-antigen/teichoic acid export membrane protein